MLYPGRPGISPVLAVLIAQGRVRKDQRILDVGCNTGTEVLLLAKWGFRSVEGIDPEAKAVAIARRRASRMGLADRVTFRRMGAEHLADTYPAGTFDVVLHTLVANNLRKGHKRHFRALARVMKPDGLLVLQERVVARHENARPGGVAPLAALRAHFTLSTGISTHLPEHASERGPAFARVVLWLGQPRPLA